jgi:hypothetical protein
MISLDWRQGFRRRQARQLRHCRAAFSGTVREIPLDIQLDLCAAAAAARALQRVI